MACFEDVFTANTLNVRNASSMTASKASFVSAISLIEESYNYLVGDTSEYPKAYIDEIKEVGDVYLEGANLLKDAIQSGGVFYVPEYFEPEDKWPTTAANTCMQIDFGKFFQAGYLSDIFERNAEGKIALYITTVGWDYYEEWGSRIKWHDEPKLIYEFVIPFTSFDTIEEDIQFEIQKLGIDTNSTKMHDIASQRTSTVSSRANVNTNTIKSKSTNKGSKNDLYVNKNINSGSSITDIANMLNRDYNNSDSDDSLEKED